MEGGGVTYNFEFGSIKGNFSLNFSAEDFNVISHNMQNWYKSAEKKIHTKTWEICGTNHCHVAES